MLCPLDVYSDSFDVSWFLSVVANAWLKCPFKGNTVICSDCNWDVEIFRFLSFDKIVQACKETAINKISYAGACFLKIPAQKVIIP